MTLQLEEYHCMKSSKMMGTSSPSPEQEAYLLSGALLAAA